MFVFGLSFQSHLTNQPSREEERERLGRKVSTLLGSTNSIVYYTHTLVQCMRTETVFEKILSLTEHYRVFQQVLLGAKN